MNHPLALVRIDDTTLNLYANWLLRADGFYERGWLFWFYRLAHVH